MTRWVFGDASGKPVIERQLGDPLEKVVTFLDFVQTLAIREVRNRYGIDEARQRYDIDYPLACRNAIYLFSDQMGQRSREHRHQTI